MLTPLENYYQQQPEPIGSCLLALRKLILSLDKNLADGWKYSMPFITHRGKMFCYFWTDKKTGQPYIGVIEGHRINHPELEQGNRSRMKILRIDANADLPVDTITEILGEALTLYR